MNDHLSIADVTQRVIDAVGVDDPSSDWVLRPEEHAANLPPEARALKRTLLRKDIAETMIRYRAGDGNAQWAQSRYKQIGGRILLATLFATLIGAAALLPSVQDAAVLRAVVTVLEFVCLFGAFLTARYLSIARPFPKWMAARAGAEVARIELFNRVMEGKEARQEGELPPLPLKLEYFRRYQLEVQRRYYGGRGQQHQRAAGNTKRWQNLCLALSVATALIAMWASLPIVESVAAFLQIQLPPLLQSLIEMTKAFAIDGRSLVPLGVAASALYAFATSRSLMNLDERNAARYLSNCDNLQFLIETELPAARASAAAGDEAKVAEFVKRVQDLISSEHKEWVSLREIVRI